MRHGALQFAYRVSGLLQRPATSWAVVAVGVVAYAVLARDEPRTSPYSLPGLSLAETAVFVVAGMAYLTWLTALTIQTVVERRQNAVVYLDVKHFWTFAENGNLSGVLIYKLQNRTRQPVSRLPVEGLIWFRRPDERELSFRIVFRDGERPHTIESENYALEEQSDLQIRMKFSKEHLLSWQPHIFPPVGPGEIITYEVEIETPKTESDAFTAAGSNIGFPVRCPTNAMELLARAPKGWRFEFTPPTWSVRTLSGHEIDRPRHPGPYTEGDGSLLRWDVRGPITGTRYIASYRLVAKGVAPPHAQ